jgi:hypothetical protein
MLLTPYALVPFTYLVVHQESSADIIPQQAQSRESITGSQWLQGDTYTKDDKVQSASVIYSPCGANGILNVNNRISLTSNSANGTGELSDDNATIAFTQQINFQWASCNST